MFTACLRELGRKIFLSQDTVTGQKFNFNNDIFLNLSLKSNLFSVKCKNF